MSSSDSIVGSSDYLTDATPQVVITKGGRTFRKLKKFNRDSDCFLDPQKLKRVPDDSTEFSQGSQFHSDDYRDPRKVKRIQNDPPKRALGHKSHLKGYYSHQLTKHLSLASKHGMKNNDSASTLHDPTKKGKPIVTTEENLHRARPEAATPQFVMNPFYDPTSSTVQKQNNLHSKRLLSNPFPNPSKQKDNTLNQKHRVPDKSTLRDHNFRQRVEPKETVQTSKRPKEVTNSWLKKYRDFITDLSSDSEEYTDSPTNLRVTKSLRAPEQPGKVGCCTKFAHCLPLQTKMIPQRKKSTKLPGQSQILDWIEDIEENEPVHAIGYSRRERTVQETPSETELNETDTLEWLQEFDTEKETIQEAEVVAKSVDTAVPACANSNCVKLNKIIVPSNIPGLRRVLTNVKKCRGTTDNKKGISVRVQFHAQDTAVMDVSGDGSSPEQVLDKAANQLRSIVAAIMQRDASGNEPSHLQRCYLPSSRETAHPPLTSRQGLGHNVLPRSPQEIIMDDDIVIISDSEDSDSTNMSEAYQVDVPELSSIKELSSDSRVLSENIAGPSVRGNVNNERQSELVADGCDAYLSLIGNEISATVSGYLSDTSTIVRASSRASLDSLGLMPPSSPSSVKDELLTDDEDAFQPRTNSKKRLQATVSRPTRVVGSPERNVGLQRNAAQAGSSMQNNSSKEPSLGLPQESVQRSKKRPQATVSWFTRFVGSPERNVGLQRNAAQAGSSMQNNSAKEPNVGLQRNAAQAGSSMENNSAQEPNVGLQRNAAQAGSSMQNNSTKEPSVGLPQEPVQRSKKRSQATVSRPTRVVDSPERNVDLQRNGAQAGSSMQNNSANEPSVGLPQEHVQRSKKRPQTTVSRPTRVVDSPERNVDLQRNGAQAGSSMQNNSANEPSVGLPQELVQRSKKRPQATVSWLTRFVGSPERNVALQRTGAQAGSSMQNNSAEEPSLGLPQELVQRSKKRLQATVSRPTRVVDSPERNVDLQRNGAQAGSSMQNNSAEEPSVNLPQEHVQRSKKRLQATVSRPTRVVGSPERNVDLQRNGAQAGSSMQNNSAKEPSVGLQRNAAQAGSSMQNNSAKEPNVGLQRNAAQAGSSMQNNSTKEPSVGLPQEPVQCSPNGQQASGSNCRGVDRDAAAAAPNPMIVSDSDSDDSVPEEPASRQDQRHNSVPQISHPVTRGTLYSDNERRRIVAYIVENNAYKLLGGKTFWEEMQSERVCPGRTWQSLKEHFHKTIMRNIRKYMTREELTKLNKGLSGSKRSRKLVGHRANFYTDAENRTLVAYLLKSTRYRDVGGVNVWKRMVDKEVLPGRTWQSLRDHYRKVLVHNLNGFDITQAEAAALRSYCPGPANT